MIYDKDADDIIPMVSENMNTDSRYHVSFFEALRKFFKNIIILIQRRLEANQEA